MTELQRELENPLSEFVASVYHRESCSFEAMLALPEISQLDEMVIGRVVLTGSLGRDRDDINRPELLAIAREVRVKAKSRSLFCALGGGVSAESVAFFEQLPDGHLDYFETRKILFGYPGSTKKDAAAGIL